jgi:hypothetical protein
MYNQLPTWFQEEGATFSPEMVVSHFLHAFLVIQPSEVTSDFYPEVKFLVPTGGHSLLWSRVVVPAQQAT